VNVIALMYHDVTTSGREHSSGFPGGDAARYKLSASTFYDHLRAIRARVTTTPLTVDALADSTGSALPLLLTFDDGGAGARTAADCLDAFGWSGHFFVTTDYIGRPGFLTAPQIRDLRRRGHVIGSHSCSHPLRMSRCPADRLRAEWERSLATIADILGERVDTASVPGGDFSDAVGASAADAGIRYLFTSRPAVATGQCLGTLVLGRYTVRRTTSAGRVAAVAAGRRLPRLQQLITWDLTRVAKATAGRSYLRVRRHWLGGSPDMRWGDH
jgi:peptidoglycan/xylan/chitin deacetylase (PgdA/CDA1 family)